MYVYIYIYIYMYAYVCIYKDKKVSLDDFMFTKARFFRAS